jgi:hypothetical protein
MLHRILLLAEIFCPERLVTLTGKCKAVAYQR